MEALDFALIGEHIDVPEAALRLMSKPEKEIRFSLNLLLDAPGFLEADAYVVYHNTARGPAKGGLRIWPGVTLDHTRALAELMTWKTALVGIPFGGGKSSISLDASGLSQPTKTAIIKEYVHVIRGELSSGAYIPAPDLGTSSADMAAIYGETHMLECVTGKPPRVGGLPGRKEATGYGVAHMVGLCCEHLLKCAPDRISVAVQGFGNVGEWTCRFLHEMGAKVVAVSDITGGVYREGGLDPDDLFRHLREGGRMAEYDGEAVTNEELLGIGVDVLVPAAVENVIDERTARSISARLVVEAANGPTTLEGETLLRERGVDLMPDILANSGGVIASYMEWQQARSGALGRADETRNTIAERLDAAFHGVIATASERQVTYRMAAQIAAVGELIATMRDRGWIPPQ